MIVKKYEVRFILMYLATTLSVSEVVFVQHGLGLSYYVYGD